MTYILNKLRALRESVKWTLRFFIYLSNGNIQCCGCKKFFHFSVMTIPPYDWGLASCTHCWADRIAENEEKAHNELRDIYFR